MALKHVLSSSIDLLKNKWVNILSDNKNVMSVLQIDRQKSELQELNLDMHDICKQEHLEMHPECTAREGNTTADSLSRRVAVMIGLGNGGFSKCWTKMGSPYFRKVCIAY